jgi:hypothetical protein
MLGILSNFNLCCKFPLACDVDWDDNILINAFWWGLQDDVKDLLMNLHDPLTLVEAITQVM